MGQKSGQSLAFFAIAIFVFAFDQVTKYWVLQHIPMQPAGMGLYLQEPYLQTIVPNLLGFIHARNSGAAFSLFSAYPAILTGVRIVLALAVLLWALFSPETTRFSRLTLGALFGGAVGNIADRFLHDFQVVDFIQVLIPWKDRYWPTFNVADIAICAGIGLFLIAAYWATPKPPPPAENPPVE